MKLFETEETVAERERLMRFDRIRSYANVGMIALALILLPLMSHAGGLGIAPLAFFVGVLGYLTAKPSSVLSIPLWVLPLALFLGWANLTASWSPHEDTQTFTNPIKIGLGAFIFLGGFLAFDSAVKTGRFFLSHIFMAVITLSMGLLLIDLLSGYSLTFLIDPLKDGEHPIYKNYSTEMNLGHAVTVLALCLPVTMMLIYQHFKMGWLLAVILAAMVLVTAIFAKLFVGILAVTGVLVCMFLARLKPQFTIRTLTWLGIFSILLAPLVGYLLGFLSEDIKAAMPFSWEHRVLMWRHVAERIAEHPLIGHGFDATRTFDATFNARGVESWAVVSLHPHNAGLHIWAETGLVGVALAVTALLMMGIAAEHYGRDAKLRSMAIAGVIATVIIVANVTYGVWQDWWWAAVILTSASIRLIPRTGKPVV